MEKYKDFFEKIEIFKNEQNKQKQRGFNNYNILTSVLNKSDEVRLHSRMIFSLLNPNGTHYQSSLFLEKFLNAINMNNFKLNLQNCSIYKEYNNIDLYITDGDKHIIIENKIYAKDQKNQIQRYIEMIEAENQKLSEEDILVIYLSLDREKPSSYGLGDLKIENNFIERKSEKIALFKSIHYNKEILNWLKSSQYEVQNITNLNEVFNQYIDVVKMLNNQYKDKVMSLSDYIKENKSFYKIAVEIQSEFPEIRRNIVESFFEKIKFYLQSELGKDWTIELIGDLSKRYKVPFRIYKKKWVSKKENNLIFGFEFDKNDYYVGYFGIVRMSNKVDIKKDIVVKFKNRLEELNFNLKTVPWWVHLESLPERIEDFAEYVMFDKYAEKKFIERVIELIKLFEIDSNLMTDMNSYLNNKP